jgi:glycosyltransferase involved in cell wall biosynthesis
MVSIVIPCFDHARFVGEAIESALAQTRPEIEVIVVDDGSRDDSAAVAARFPVRLIRQTNQGLSAARNAGLRASRGDVLICLDADDRLYPTAAAAAVAAFERSPSAMLAFGRCRLIDEDGRPLLTNLPRVTGSFYAELLRRNYIWTPAMAAFRRTVFDQVGAFNPRFNPSADYDLYLRIARRFEIVSHDTLVADYRQHGRNMSRNPVLMLDTTLAVLRQHRDEARRSTETWTAWRDGMRHWREFYGEHLVERFRAALRTRGESREALRCAYHLLRLYPRGVATHLRKKAALLLHAGRATPAAEMTAAISRASDSPGRR